jgi:hypothetical protein
MIVALFFCIRSLGGKLVVTGGSLDGQILSSVESFDGREWTLVCANNQWGMSGSGRQV